MRPPRRRDNGDRSRRPRSGNRALTVPEGVDPQGERLPSGRWRGCRHFCPGEPFRGPGAHDHDEVPHA
jgi:hypothetical protein